MLFFDGMKRYILVLIVSAFCYPVLAQDDTEDAPYKKFKAFPPVELILPDSSIFTKADLPKKKPVMLMLFNPVCDHCKHETEEIIKNIDKFEDIQIIMATSMPFDSMMVFRERFQLAKYKNIIVAKDQHFFLMNYFLIHSLPLLAFYNKKHEFISIFEGTLPIPAILNTFKE